MARQQAEPPCLQVDLVGVAEGLLDEEDFRAAVREVGPFAEVRQPPDVRRQVGNFSITVGDHAAHLVGAQGER